MAVDVRSFDELIDLTPGPDGRLVGISPTYPWGRVYGGQVVSQALAAAMRTVDDQYLVHSLHAYFIRGGDFDRPIEFEVDPLRDGRSFVTRRVVARQGPDAILNLSASFQVREEGQAEVQELSMPEVPPPDELEGWNWSRLLDRRLVPTSAGRAAMWLRMTDDLGDDPHRQALALAYTSDDIPTEAASSSHGDLEATGLDPNNFDTAFISASLDHAVYFHRPGRHDEWVLHDFVSHGLTGARGLGVGNVFARDGTHLATIVQEVLLRRRTR